MRGMVGDRNQCHGQSAAVPVLTTVPPGGMEVRQGAAAVRARGGEPAGAPTPRGGGYPVATPSQPPCRPVRRLRYGLPVYSRSGKRARDRCSAGLPPPLSRVLHGSAPSGGLSGDRHDLRRGPHSSGSHARRAVRCSDSHGVMGQRSTGVKTYGMLLVQHARTTSNDCF